MPSRSKYAVHSTWHKTLEGPYTIPQAEALTAEILEVYKKYRELVQETQPRMAQFLPELQIRKQIRNIRLQQYDLYIRWIPVTSG